MKKLLRDSAYKITLLLMMGCLTGYLPAQHAYIPDAPLEEFQLTTDRDLYIAGEMIQFSTLCIGDDSPEKLPLSKVIYLELFDAERKIIQRGKFNFKDGCSSGQLKIPQEQNSGVYYLRAYTQYLRNFHHDTWPLKVITIINPAIPLSKRNDQPANRIMIFPSGGKLVSGLPAEVAVYANGTISQEVSYISLLARDTVIIPKIKYFSNGLGYFEFTPKANTSYSLLTHLNNGDSLLIPMTPADESGMAMIVQEAGDQLTCRILNNDNSPLAKRNKYHLTISGSDFSTLYVDSVSGTSPVREFKVDKKILSTGINYFALYDENHNLLKIGMHYQLPLEVLHIDIKADNPSYAGREKINLEFGLPANDEDHIIHSSLAVVKKGTVRPNNNLLSAWMIDQPGLIPCQFFYGETATTDLELQLKIALIRYQGQFMGRTDAMNEIKQDHKALLHIPETRNISISGYVKDNNSGTPAAGSRVFLSYVGGPSQILVNETQSDGYFIFPVMPYHDSQDLFLCTFDELPDQEILINSDFANDFPPLNEIPLEIDTNDRKLLEELYINSQLYAMLYQETMDENKPGRMRELGFGTPEISIRPEDYIDLPSMEVMLSEIVPYVKVRKRKGNYRITVLDSETGLSYENHLVMVDNIPLDDINELMQIHPSKVEQIDVINRTYVLGDHTFQGIIMVKTLTENFGGITMPADAVFIKYPLIQEENRFCPVNGGDDGHQHKADLRNVLFWDPDLKVTQGEKTSFRASDHLSDYEVILTGMTSEGRSVYGKTTIKVR